jgi:hypothetical protein
VSSLALSGLSFDAIQAFAATDVWASAVPAGSNGPALRL